MEVNNLNYIRNLLRMFVRPPFPPIATDRLRPCGFGCA